MTSVQQQMVIEKAIVDIAIAKVDRDIPEDSMIHYKGKNYIAVKALHDYADKLGK